MTLFPELHYTRKERIKSASDGFIIILSVFGVITVGILLLQFLGYLINEGIVAEIFRLLVLPITVPANLAASVTDNSNIGTYGLGFAAGSMSFFFYAIFIYLTLFYWWLKPISGKELAYLLWAMGHVIGFTLFMWVMVLFSINFWMELFVARHPVELAEITDNGMNTFVFSILFTALAVVAIIGWFFLTFKELSLQVKGSYYRRALGIIFGVQLIGGLANVSMFWNGTIGQDFFMASVGFIGAVGLLAWWNGCDQAYQMVKALKEKAPQEEKFSVNMPEVEIPIPERKMCSLKGMGISTIVVSIVVLLILFIMYLNGESSTETVVAASTNVVENSENHFAWFTSSISWFFSLVVLPLSLLFDLGFIIGQASGLPMPFEQNAAGWILGLLFASAGLGWYVAWVCAFFTKTGNYILAFLKILKFWSISWATLGLIVAITSYIATLWIANFASLHFDDASNARHLTVSVFALFVLCMVTGMWWAVCCPERYQNYWTFCTRAIATPFVALFLALMTTITTGAWPTWFMFYLAMLIIASVLGYIYSNGVPSVLETDKQSVKETPSLNQPVTA